MEITELETLKLQVEYLEDKIAHLELRLQNAMVYIDILNQEKVDKEQFKG